MDNVTVENEPVVVNSAEEFKRMPKEYQDLVTHQMLVHTEGELTGADDYIQVFYPMAPDAYERFVCCERAAEEMDHYMRGARCLDEIGIDTSYMLGQRFDERPYYRNEIVREIHDWTQRGLFSFLGEAAVLEHLFEMRESSYRPFAETFDKIIKDEHVHVSHGYRIIKNKCQTEEGRAEVQEAIGRFWPATLDLFGKSDSTRSKEYLRWGLRKYSNEEARRRFLVKTRSKLESLGLKVPDDEANRKFV
jgi:ring-1,2-phenylacetyl-CoA epoxidase subunit PaaA